MRKILIVSLLLVIFMFLIACAPKPFTDEELKAELSKLTPEERAQLLKDLDNEEGGAFAGQAIRTRYPSISANAASRIAATPKAQVQAVVSSLSDTLDPKLVNLNLPACTDSDDNPDGSQYYPGHEENIYLQGIATGRPNINSSNPGDWAAGSIYLAGPVGKHEDFCNLYVRATDKSDIQKRTPFYVHVKVNNCNDIKVGDDFKEGPNYDDWKIDSIEGCDVKEFECSIFSHVTVAGYDNYLFPLVRDNYLNCPNGCKDGACIK